MEAMFCEIHDGVKATHRCSVCGVPVCDDCAVTTGGTVLCNDAGHAALHSTHALAVETPTMFEMDLLQKNLEEHGIAGHRFEPGQYGTDAPSRLFILRTDLPVAASLIDDLGLRDFTSEGGHDE